MQRKGPGTKGAPEPEAGQEGSRGSLPDKPPAAPRHPFPQATTPARNLPAAAAFQAPPAPRPPPQVGCPRQPIARRSSTGAVLVPSEVTCSARLAVESVEALLSGRLSQLRWEKNMARPLEGAKARVAVETKAPAA